MRINQYTLRCAARRVLLDTGKKATDKQIEDLIELLGDLVVQLAIQTDPYFKDIPRPTLIHSIKRETYNVDELTDDQTPRFNPNEQIPF